jgi:hypothetical protein
MFFEEADKVAFLGFSGEGKKYLLRDKFFLFLLELCIYYI